MPHPPQSALRRLLPPTVESALRRRPGSADPPGFAVSQAHPLCADTWAPKIREESLIPRLTPLT